VNDTEVGLNVQNGIYKPLVCILFWCTFTVVGGTEDEQGRAIRLKDEESFPA